MAELRQAVRYITEREKGGLLFPDEKDEKTGLPVSKVLEEKHPANRDADPTALPKYDSTPNLVPCQITEDIVEEVASKLSGGAGLGGLDSIHLKHLLLRHGRASRKLRIAVGRFSDWLSNKMVPWAAIRALNAGRLIGIDKFPGVRPVSIGELWKRLITKCFLLVAGQTAKEVCGVDQLCAGLEAGVEGGVHSMVREWELMDKQQQLW